MAENPPSHAASLALAIFSGAAVLLGAALSASVVRGLEDRNLEAATDTGLSRLADQDGAAGLEVLDRHREAIVAVLLDLTMPRLDGLETLEAIRKVREDLPVILCSGYPEQASVERFAGLGLSGFLHKPYTPEDLLARVQAALVEVG